MTAESHAPSKRRAAARGQRWFLAALLLATVVGVLLLLLPLSAGQADDRSVHYRSLLATEGAAIILPLALPALVCAVPLLVPARRRRATAWASAALLGLGVVASLLSVGVFFLPSVVLLAVGAARSRSRGPAA